MALKGHGNGEFTGLCPFHQEKTPSFTLSDRKGFYHCFGCGAHGDIVDFVQRTQGYSYMDTLTKLALEAGVELPKKAAPSSQQKLEERLMEIFELAAQFYQRALISKEGHHAMQYLLSRGLKKESIASYRLGYAPNDSAELSALLLKNFTASEVEQSTVLMRGEYGLYNQFRGRIIFPICDRMGRVIAFGGRRLGEGNGPKYLNSPENPVFDKGATLYGLHLATKGAYSQNEIIVVEGYMDVVALANVGIEIAVAPLGANIKAKQVETLWHIVPVPTICMDNDMAGQKAAYRLAHSILPHLKAGKSVQFIDTGMDKDPDEFVRAHGAEAFIAIMRQSTPLVQMLFEEARRNMGNDTPENRLALKGQLVALAGSIPDRGLQTSYRQFFLDKLYQLTRPQFKRKKPTADSKQKQAIQPHIASIMQREGDTYIVPMLVALAYYPELLERQEIFEALLNVELQTEYLDKTRDAIVELRDCSSHEREAAAEDIVQKLQGRGYPAAALSVDDAEEARGIIELAMKVCDLRNVQQQIIESVKVLAHEANEVQMQRLLNLKEYENLLKSQLNFV